MSNFIKMLNEMRRLYKEDPLKAVRSKSMIQCLENYIKNELESQLNSNGKRDLKVNHEVRIFHAEKMKSVDISVIHPEGGPLITVGVRSQNSSLAKNMNTYYQDIIGECVGVQSRYPMSVHAYVYTIPKEVIMEGKVSKEIINHKKYAELLNSLGGRSKLNDLDYKNALLLNKTVYDYMSFFVVDYKAEPIKTFKKWEEEGFDNLTDIEKLPGELIKTFKKRFHFLDYFN